MGVLFSMFWFELLLMFLAAALYDLLARVLPREMTSAWSCLWVTGVEAV